MTHFLLLVLEALSTQDLVGLVASIIGAFLVLKSGLLQSLFTSSKALLEIRTAERDALAAEVKELREEGKLLRRELMQRTEIYLQDQQHARDSKTK